jgi:tankyrase
LFLFIAGYNNLEVAEFLLDHGADVNAQDKGGLIPLHNASSYGHLDIAALLIKFNTVVNAADKWGFTPLHEAAQKGRTQLCALLVNYVILIKLCRNVRQWFVLYHTCT